jgi:hypothetical protein
MIIADYYKLRIFTAPCIEHLKDTMLVPESFPKISNLARSSEVGNVLMSLKKN